mmetsp:Transcript_47853/g.116440  ORF Transcript_47853/g.116440 Transcript_47853/m.116440 type:complete len:324 (+) Transcript_47853:138-1109(+)
MGNPFAPDDNEQQPLVATTTTATATATNTRRRRGSSGQDALCTSLWVFLIVTFSIVFLISAVEFSFVVPPGHIAVVVTMGHVSSHPPGLRFRFPFISRLDMMTAKTQILEEQNNVPTMEGLSVTLDTAILFRVDGTLIEKLYSEVGLDYIKIIIEPEAASAVRGLTSEKEAKALYSSGRNMIQDTVKEELKMKLGPRGIIIEDVLLKDIQLPSELTRSIEEKVQAEQEAIRMEFVLQKESQEAKRKSIEAQGVANFQQIVSEGISPELLQWKGIEATEKFSDSQNTKIVIIGNDKGSLPVILSADTPADNANHPTTTKLPNQE